MGNSKDNKQNPVAKRQPFSPEFGHLISEFGSLSQAERLSFARAVAGIVGAQLTFGAPSAPIPQRQSPGERGAKGGKPPPQQKAPTSVLAGTDVKKAYDAIKKKASKAKASGTSLSTEEAAELAARKEEYFRALGLAKSSQSSAGGQKGAPTEEAGEGSGGSGAK